MKISFSTNAFVRYSVFEALERIAAIGYQGVELLADVPHLYPPTISPQEIAKIRELLDRKGLEPANINANTAVGYYGRTFWEPLFEPSLAHPDFQLRKWRIDYTRKCLEFAKELRVPNISITSGRTVPGIHPEKSLSLFEESLLELLDYSANLEVAIGVEYEPGLLVENFQELLGLIQRINCPWLGCNLDIGHSYLSGENLERVLESLSYSIFHIHLEDIRNRKHFHLIPGHGEIDFHALFQILNKHNYRGFVTVELYTYPQEPENAAREAFRYLNNLTLNGKIL